MSQTDEDLEDLPTDSEAETVDPSEGNAEAEEGEVTGEYDGDEGLEGEGLVGEGIEEEQGGEEETVKEEEDQKEEEEVEPEVETEPGAVEEGADEGGEEEGEEEEAEEEEPSYYDPDDFISVPRLSKNSTLPMDILDFDFSYGYDCRKNFNLAVLDEEMVVFGSGNFLNFLNVTTGEIKLRRSALGGGVGNIRKNPNPDYPHFAVAESGKRPIIIIYEWPAMEIVCILKGGASHVYTNMDFSPNGDLLASQSGEPDFLITIWNWREHKILLRNKSYVNEVFRVKFSPYVPGQLTSCGLAHIKFWKMASTFTGLKLKGELGRFGKTEYSDIMGVLPMPDEKVISGCYWGNLLVWDGGLIVLEVCRSMRKTCHDAQVVQMSYDGQEGELWTVSMDGHIRVWWYEKIDQADPPDDDRVVEIEPSYDFYTPGLMLMSIEKRRLHDETDTFYFGQDGNGGIWLIDLNTEAEPLPSVQIYKCHAGEIMDLATCPFGPYLASLGKDGRIYLYNYLNKKRIFDYDFPAKGSSLIWLPLNIINTGDVIVAGFDDGQLRVICVSLLNEEKVKFTLTQVIKPHNKPITKISVNATGTLLVSAAEDCTIFIFKLDTSIYAKDLLIPIGYIPTPEIVTCITWDNHNDAEVLVGCLRGKMMQVEVPYSPQPYTGISYLLKVEPKYNLFSTYKAQIRRDIKVREIEAKKAKKLAKKMEALEAFKKENPGLEIDEEVFLADSEADEVLEPLYIPEIPNKILWLRYTDNDTIWLSMAGYDAGYIYEYLLDQKDGVPYRFKMVDDADDIEISCYVYSYNEDYLIFAMEDGTIRVNKVNKSDFRDLSDYWTLAMHDNQNGYVSKMCFSYDESYFFSGGYDGNVFAYRFDPEDHICPEITETAVRFSVPMYVKDLDTYTKLSLEEMKIKAENDRIQKLANERKAYVREIVKDLKERYARVLLRNAKLLPTQVIPKKQLELDKRVTEEVDKRFTDKLKLVKRKLAYDVEKSEIHMKKLLRYFTDPADKLPLVVKGINHPEVEARTVKQRKISPRFFEMIHTLENKLVEEMSKGRPPERTVAPQRGLPPKADKTSGLEYFLLSLSPSVIEHQLGPKLNRILIKYRERKSKWDKRSEEVRKLFYSYDNILLFIPRALFC